MSWFQQNRFLGMFAAGFGVAVIGALLFLWMAKSGFDTAKAELDQQASELSALQRHTPYPNAPNLQRMKAQAEEYANSLKGVKEELKTRVLPAVPMAPNEFQNRLRQAAVTMTERARANKVKLPDNFFLGFEEYASALPDTAAAPVLGQQLAQVEMLMNILIDAKVDTVITLRRAGGASAAVPAAAATPKPGPKTEPAGPPLLERTTLELSFHSPPTTARRVLNQIATLNQQFYIIRTLHVVNEKQKGPPREVAATTGAAPDGAAAAAPGGTLNFIVGNERVTTSARVEMVRIAF